MDSEFDYNQMVQRALRGVMSEALTIAAEHGMSGDHHFFITFLTDHPGVDMPSWLRDEYPEAITIALQHQFYDLAVAGDRFSVSLSFRNRPATLVVPLKAVRRFADPSVEFSLMLQPETPLEEIDELEEAAAQNGAESDAAPGLIAGAPMEGDVVSLDAFRKK